MAFCGRLLQVSSVNTIFIVRCTNTPAWLAKRLQLVFSWLYNRFAYACTAISHDGVSAIFSNETHLIWILYAVQ